MKQSFKGKIADASSGNIEFNRKVITMKKSFDEVNKILTGTNIQKKRKQK